MHAIINNMPVEFNEGDTILEAARRAGIFIPTLCEFAELHHRPGTCRMCLVEVEHADGASRVVTACETRLLEGDRVNTRTQKVRGMQKLQAELLFSDHCEKCSGCARHGSCELQTVAAQVGLDVSALSGRLNTRPAAVDDSAAGLVFTSDKCIRCLRCVEVCRQLHGIGAITLNQTGTVQFDNASTSTPTLCNGKIYVGGADRRAAGTGSISAIDAQTLKVERHVTTTSAVKHNAIPGDVKSAPLVVTKLDGTYVYFTSNGRPGGVFMYKVGAEHVTLLYVPEKEQRQYNMASVVAAADGSLYFVNDSGYLFKLAGASTADVLPSQEVPGQSGTEDSGKDAGKDSGKDSGKNSGKNAGSQGEKGKGSGSAHAAGAGNTAAGGKGGNGSAGTKSGSAKPGSMKVVHGVASPAGGKASGAAATSGPLALLKGVASDVLGIQVQDGASDGTSEGTASTGGASADAPAKATASKAAATASRGRTLPIWPVIGMALGAVVLIMALLRRGKRDERGTK